MAPRRPRSVTKTSSPETLYTWIRARSFLLRSMYTCGHNGQCSRGEKNRTLDMNVFIEKVSAEFETTPTRRFYRSRWFEVYEIRDILGYLLEYLLVRHLKAWYVLTNLLRFDWISTLFWSEGFSRGSWGFPLNPRVEFMSLNYFVNGLRLLPPSYVIRGFGNVLKEVFLRFEFSVHRVQWEVWVIVMLTIVSPALTHGL